MSEFKEFKKWVEGGSRAYGFGIGKLFELGISPLQMFRSGATEHALDQAIYQSLVNMCSECRAPAQMWGDGRSYCKACFPY